MLCIRWFDLNNRTCSGGKIVPWGIFIEIDFSLINSDWFRKQSTGIFKVICQASKYFPNLFLNQWQALFLWPCFLVKFKSFDFYLEPKYSSIEGLFQFWTDFARTWLYNKNLTFVLRCATWCDTLVNSIFS